MDESKLHFNKDSHDIYTAHEIAQLQPLFERGETYAKFLKQNIWISKFLPNVLAKGVYMLSEKWSTNYYTLYFLSILFESRPIEKIIRTIQLAIIKKHKTTEKVTESMLAFHPNNYRLKTLSDLNRKMTEIGLLTNI